MKRIAISDAVGAGIDSRVLKRTTARTKLLRALLDAAGEWRYGFDIARDAGISPGSLYPNLEWLEQQGWLEARWEDADPSDLKRPRRRYYRLTEHGIEQTRAWLPPSGAQVARYRRRVTVVRAIQWRGDNLAAVMAFAGKHLTYVDDVLTCHTLHGPDVVVINDWLVEGADNDVYPIKPKPFAAVYEPAD